MADIRPFRAWRFNRKIEPIESLISSLFNSEDNKSNTLYENPYNSIHISAPSKAPGLKNISFLVNEWKQDKIIVQDNLPAIYVYYQYFKLHDSDKIHCQKGFICDVKLEEQKEKQILKHEALIPSSSDATIDLLENSLMNMTPTHGLYSDPEHLVEKFMDESISNPMYEVKDEKGILNKLSVIQDRITIEKFISLLKCKPIILADGHHRLNASIHYKEKQKQKTAHFTGLEAYNFHCMYLTNTEANEIKILPTHRLINQIENFNSRDFIEKLSQYFKIQKIESPDEIEKKIERKKWSFGIVVKGEQFTAELKPGLISEITWNFPQQVKELDLTVMHFFIIGKVLGISDKDQKKANNLTFSYNFMKSISEVNSNKAQIALITREIPMEEVKKVCYSGYTFPQKSTFFYPKVICGLVFNSIKQEDFLSSIDLCIKL
jgi:uncharacterized protein (DUF1015 family)